MRRKMRTQWRLEESAQDADHVWDPIRDRIDVAAVWTRHGTTVYVNLRRRPSSDWREMVLKALLTDFEKHVVQLSQ
jgi:hypothetical protein